MEKYIFQINPVKNFELWKALHDPELQENENSFVFGTYTRGENNPLKVDTVIYFWESTKKGRGLVARGKVVQEGSKKPMPEWQIKYICKFEDYDANAIRTDIEIIDILETPIERNKIENYPILKNYPLFKKVVDGNKKGTSTRRYLYKLDDHYAEALDLFFFDKNFNETLESLYDQEDDSLTTIEKKILRRHLKDEYSGRIDAKKVKKVQGYICKACNFDFEKAYGQIGKEFIEAHHIVPYSKHAEGERKKKDLRYDFAVLCANCHRMIHRMMLRHDKPHDLDSFKKFIKVQYVYGAVSNKEE